MSESFNNTGIIKIRNTMNGLHITYRQDGNPDHICEHVIENNGDELDYSLRVINVISDLLNLEFKDCGKFLRLEIVEESEDCD